MKKIINKENYTITYRGKIKELKDQLLYLIGEWGPQWKEQILEDIFNLKKIKTENYANVSDMWRRIYYSDEKILYLSNSSSKNVKKILFPVIQKNSFAADKKFVRKHGKKSLEIIHEKKRIASFKN